MIDGKGGQGLTKDLISLSENKLTYWNCHHQYELLISDSPAKQI